MAELPERPMLASGVERRDFETYGVLAPPGDGSVLHIEPDELAVLDLLDGSHTLAELEAIFGGDITALLRDLYDEGFLEGSQARPAPGRFTFTFHGIEMTGFDRFVQAINRAVGDFVFSAPGAVLWSIVAVVGFGLFAAQVNAGKQLTVSDATPVLAVVVLRVLSLATVLPHETAHALVLVRHRRKVGRVGVGFYWGALTFYVDASAALFLDRRTRMFQAAAGMLTDLFFAGAASVIAIAGGNATWAVVLREIAVLSYLNIIINAVPLLELDGYWLLADALDRPTLQRDARAALSALLHRHAFDRRLALYGLTSLTFGLALIGLGVAAWWGLFGGLFLRLWEGGFGYKLLAVYLILPFVPMVLHLSVQLVRYVRGRSAPVDLATNT